MPTAATAKRQTKDQRRQSARALAAEQRRIAAEMAAERQEALDEAIAPSVQRKPVLTRPRAKPDVVEYLGKGLGQKIMKGAVIDEGGDVLRAARVERDGVAFVRANPLAWIAAKTERGQGMFRPEHIAAAKRLVTVWDAVGLGIGPASVDLGMPRATRASAPHTPPQHAALVKQVAQQDEIKLVYNYMRGLWPMWECLHGVVIRGTSPTAWAVSVHIEPKAASGILLSSLALLARVYADIDPPVPTPRHRIRTWAPGERSRAESDDI